MKTLIMLRGKPGTGKSTLSDALGKALGAAVIDKDDVKDVLDERYRDEHVGGLTYLVMLRVAERCLSAGVSVVCDSPLTFPNFYARAVEIAARQGAELRLIRTVCSDREEWKRRLETRAGMPEHRVRSIDDPRLQGADLYEAREAVIDTARPFEEVLAEAIAICRELETA